VISSRRWAATSVSCPASWYSSRTRTAGSRRCPAKRPSSSPSAVSSLAAGRRAATRSRTDVHLPPRVSDARSTVCARHSGLGDALAEPLTRRDRLPHPPDVLHELPAALLRDGTVLVRQARLPHGTLQHLEGVLRLRARGGHGVVRGSTVLRRL